MSKKGKKDKAGLTPKQTLFVAEYLKDLNATRAARAAGYAAARAEITGSELVRNRKVAAAIQRSMDKRSKRIEIDQDKVLEWISDTAERCRNLKLVTDKKGRPVMMPTDEPCPICEGEKTVDVGEAIRRDCPACDATGKLLRAAVVSFEPFAVLKAAELAGKHLKMFTDKMELSGDEEMLKALAEGRQRVATNAG